MTTTSVKMANALGGKGGLAKDPALRQDRHTSRPSFLARHVHAKKPTKKPNPELLARLELALFSLWLRGKPAKLEWVQILWWRWHRGRPLRIPHSKL